MILRRTQTQTCCDREGMERSEGGCCCGYRVAVGTVTNQSEHPHISPGGSNQHRGLSLTWHYQTHSSGRVSHGTKSV